jgi:tetratricopeptide (TPR) repeat protein
MKSRPKHGKRPDKLQPPAQRPTARLIALALLVALTTAAAHWTALSSKTLSFDDHSYLVRNPLVQNPSWNSTQRFLTEVLHPSTVDGYYQPLTMISIMLDCAIGGAPDNLRPFHATSLALHVVNTLLILALVYSLFGNAYAAAFGALLFGVHPLTVEPIPWIGERKTLLAAFFSLISMIAYIRYTKRSGRAPYIISIASFLLALLSKPTSIPLPIMLILLDIWPLRRLSKQSLIEQIPHAALAFISAIITYLSQASSFIETPSQRGLIRIPLMICHNIIFYLYKMVWPANLSSHYPMPPTLSLSQPMVLAGVIGTALLAVALIASWRYTRAAAIGWLIFFIAIFPTLGVVGFTTVIASDKYVYLPAIGLLIALTFLLDQLWTRANPTRRKLLTIGILLIAIAEFACTRAYLAKWQSNLDFHRYMVTLAPDADIVHFALGFTLEQEGNLNEAIPEYRRAVECKGMFLNAARFNLALLLAKQGHHVEAESQYQALLAAKPRELTDVHLNFGYTLMSLQKHSEALEHFHRALELTPDHPKVLNNMGIVYAQQGKYFEALPYFEKAAAVDPNLVEAQRNIGNAQWQLGEPTKAIPYFERAMQLSPGDLRTQLNYARVLSAARRLPEAIREYEKAIQMNPNDQTVQLELGAVKHQLTTNPQGR